ncbi:MAG: type IV toxin-antitoxin system AbiEi family antitoxin domain-containing protein [Solirubrobacteraceae bacterium]
MRAKAAHQVMVLGVRSPVIVAGDVHARIGVIASAQKGCVARRQLLAAGIGPSPIDRLIRQRALIPLHRGVYAVGHCAPLPWRDEAAALLACREAVLGCRTAAGLWGFGKAPEQVVEVMISERRYLRVAGVHVHRTRLLRARDIRIRHGLPVTSPARTLLDISPTLTESALGWALDEALGTKILRPNELLQLLDHCGNGHQGTFGLRRLLARRRRPGITRFEAERALRDLIRSAQLPEPETQVWIAGFQVDFLWRELGVAFEVDGFRLHTSRSAFDRDRRKDVVLRRHHVEPNRVSRDQVIDEPLVVLAQVAEALTRARERARRDTD